ncbi:hypothetical protein BH11BAC5_BH11BAC5_17670 [soil metagenome]
MDLFNTSPAFNILPNNGTVNYHGVILKKLEAAYYLKRLLDSIEWKHDEAVIFGKFIILSRQFLFGCVVLSKPYIKRLFKYLL